MPGFFVLIGDKSTNNNIIRKSKIANVLVRQKSFDNAFIESYVTEKFFEEKLFYENNEFFVLTDGILLNIEDIKTNYLNDSKNNLGEIVINLYKELGINFLKLLRGNFSGLILDKLNKTWYLFTDHTSTKPIYWFFDKEAKLFVASSELKSITHYLKSKKRRNSLNIEGAYALLTFGYMLEDMTLVEGIKKLTAGSYLKFNENSYDISLESYYKLDNTPIYDSDDQIFRNLTERFSEAIRAEYQKDIKYGYQSIAQLSGGLDSKTSVIVAVKQGFEPVTLCFSESDYLDEKIAKKVARDLKLEFIFHSLDNGLYLKNTLEDSIEANDGLILYIGSAHVLNAIRKINKKLFGIMHTGMIGDAVLGSFVKGYKHTKLNFKDFSLFAYSRKLINRLSEYYEKVKLKYPNTEMFGFYNRAFNGTYNGYRITEQYFEFSSPFTYVDFMEYALRIPPEKKSQELIYIKWLEKMIPEVSKYPWEKKVGLSINAPMFYVTLKRAIRKVRAKFLDYRLYSMNPFEYWIKHNPEIIDYMTKRFLQLSPNLSKYPELYKDCEYLFFNGNTIEKSQVLTFLAAIKLHDIE